MQLIEVLVVGLIFMALLPSVMTLFINPTWYVSTIGNNATFTNATAIAYPTTYNAIFSIVPLLLVVGLLYLVWSGKKKGGQFKI